MRNDQRLLSKYGINTHKEYRTKSVMGGEMNQPWRRGTHFSEGEK